MNLASLLNELGAPRNLQDAAASADAILDLRQTVAELRTHHDAALRIAPIVEFRAPDVLWIPKLGIAVSYTRWDGKVREAHAETNITRENIAGFLERAKR